MSVFFFFTHTQRAACARVHARGEHRDRQTDEQTVTISSDTVE